MKLSQTVNLAKGFAQYHSATLIRLGIVLGVICALPALGYLATNPRMVPLILAAVIAPIGILAVLRQIELGFLAMLVSGMFVRFRLPTGTSSEIVMSLLLCGGILGIWGVRMLVESKRLTLKPAPTNFPLLVFVIVIFISLAWGRAYRDVLVHDIGSPFVAVASAVVMAFLPITLLLVANIVQDVRWLRAMVWVFLAGGFVSLISTLDISLSYTIRRLVFQNGLIWVNTHGLYSMWYLTFSLAMALFNRKLHWALRSLLLIYAAGWIYWGFWQRTTWLSGWVPAFAAAGMVTLLHSKKLFIIVLIVAVVGAGGYYWRTALEAETEESGNTRLAAYAVNWRVTSKHLLFGVGPAGYAAYYMSYFPAEGMATHSNYIDILSQFGIVGTIFILWFFGVQVRSGYKLRLRLRKRGDFAETLSVAVLAGTCGCLIAMALGDWLFPFAYTQGIVGFDAAMFNWFFMGMAWALHYILTSETPGARNLQTVEEVTV